jgi:hypothetical protein
VHHDVLTWDPAPRCFFIVIEPFFDEFFELYFQNLLQPIDHLWLFWRSFWYGRGVHPIIKGADQAGAQIADDVAELNLPS